MIKIVRVNEDCKERLITLKRYTGIQNWNVLCRWAFCISMADKTKVPSIDKKGEVGVEMTWRVFAGELGDIFLALLHLRCKEEEIEINEKNLSEQLWLHLHRGLGHMVANKDFKSDASVFGKTPITLLRMTQ